MKKRIDKYATSGLLIFLTVSAFGQGIKLQGGPEYPVLAEKELPAGKEIIFEAPALILDTVRKAGELYYTLHCKGMSKDDYPGKPFLPVLHRLISRKNIKALYYTVEEDTFFFLPDKKIMILPVPQPVITGTESSNPVFTPDPDVYLADHWYSDSASVTLTAAGIMSNAPIGLLTVRPVYYNPKQGSLRYAKRIRIRLEEGTLKSAGATSPFIDQMLRARLLCMGHPRKDTMTRIPISYIILADTMFRKALQPFVAWKKQIGYKVTVVYKGEDGAGNTAETMQEKLKEIYQHDMAENSRPTYLLICGDQEVIPAFYGKTSGHLTDLYYAEYDGNSDFLPDVYFGRLSARTPKQLENQIAKIMEYEKCLMPSTGYLDTALLIAGVDYTYAPTYGNGQINYASQYYFSSPGEAHAHVFLHPESGSRKDSILALMNRGVGFINYTGHGQDNRWMNPNITTTDIDSLKNGHKYPVVITNGCRTNAFGYEVSFGEALLRQAGGGAVGHIGGTNDTYWDEDYYWAVGVGTVSANPEYNNTTLGAYDRLFHTHSETPSEWYTTLGQIVFAGNLAVLESGSSRTRYYWEVYHLLGDPSLMVYLRKPDTQTCLYPETLPEGITRMTVLTEPDAYVAISLNGEPLDAASTGTQTLAAFSFAPLHQGDTISLFVSKQNRKPVIATIPVVGISGAYIAYTGDTLNEIKAVTNNHKAERTEVLSMGIRIKNLGNAPASNLILTLTSADTLLRITDSIISVSSIQAGKEFTSDTGFILQVSDFAPNKKTVLLRLNASDLSGSWASSFPVTLYAPEPEICQLWYDDSLQGNANGTPDPGERFSFRILVRNSGDSPMADWPFCIASPGTEIAFHPGTITSKLLYPGDSILLRSEGMIDPALSYGDTITVEVSSGVEGYPALKQMEIITGGVTDHYETGALHQLPYTMEGDAGWMVDTWNAYDGRYSARSGIIGDSKSSIMQIRVYYPENGTISFSYRVSSESAYDFFDFLIDGNKILRQSGFVPWTRNTWTVEKGWHTFTWQYSKDSNTSYGKDAVWIDHLLMVPAVTDTTADLSLSEILRPAQDSSWGEMVNPLVRILNRSQIALGNPALYISVNNGEPVCSETGILLRPGNSSDYEFPFPVQLPGSGNFFLTAWIEHPLDAFPQNDTLHVSFKKTGIIPSADTMPFTLWPVPASEYIYLSTAGINGKLRFAIVTITGQTILEGNLPENRLSCPIYTGNLANGVYLLRISTIQGKILKKKYFVVQH